MFKNSYFDNNPTINKKTSEEKEKTSTLTA